MFNNKRVQGAETVENHCSSVQSYKLKSDRFCITVIASRSGLTTLAATYLPSSVSLMVIFYNANHRKSYY